MILKQKQTTDHETIWKWASHFLGMPYLDKSGAEAVLCVGFPGGKEKKVILISWEEWFDRFEEENLILYYEDEIEAGGKFPWYKLSPRPGDTDLHLQAPAEANREKHINFLEQEEKLRE